MRWPRVACASRFNWLQRTRRRIGRPCGGGLASIARSKCDICRIQAAPCLVQSGEWPCVSVPENRRGASSGTEIVFLFRCACQKSAFPRNPSCEDWRLYAIILTVLRQEHSLKFFVTFGSCMESSRFRGNHGSNLPRINRVRCQPLAVPGAGSPAVGSSCSASLSAARRRFRSKSRCGPTCSSCPGSSACSSFGSARSLPRFITVSPSMTCSARRAGSAWTTMSRPLRTTGSFGRRCSARSSIRWPWCRSASWARCSWPCC